MGTLRNYLELVRFPGVFTAHADIAAGFLIAGGGIPDLPNLCLLLISSSLFFFAGMALNDYFDYAVDRIERPNRPLPSGRISRNKALATGIGLLGGALLISLFVNRTSFAVGVMLAAAIAFYDGGVKNRRWMGPINMGLCRYLNLLLGLSLLPLDRSALLIPLITGGYIFGVSLISASETTGNAPFAVVLSAMSFTGVFLLYRILQGFHILPAEAGFYSVLVAVAAILFMVFRLVIKKTPKDFQITMKWLLVSHIIIDGTLVAGVKPFWEALWVWVLIVPAAYVSRRFYMT